ncbi:MAG: hypothetical protein U1C70_14275 [Sediminibacterium sp.]|jgi:hypothetical protein|uniref:hypothetical protein n=1 Tax=Sediminibacterium sp. TaxID=1917865 RepID=UPI002ABAEB08|nr:hypothetical protein [Sediminibacterium sp.]MDZ4072985.1 hypothetical protein [Sediminibacterium sp.]
MAKQRKPYNPNTAYGKRKLREQSREEYENMTPDEQSAALSDAWMLFIVVVIFRIIMPFLTGGKEGVMKWLTR